MVLISVDLPQPLGPSTATCSFTAMRRLKSSRTIFCPLVAPPRITRTLRKSSNGPWGRGEMEFIGLSQNCNVPAISRGYRSDSCPSNREGLLGRPWGAPGCPFLFLFLSRPSFQIGAHFADNVKANVSSIHPADPRFLRCSHIKSAARTRCTPIARDSHGLRLALTIVNFL